MILWELQLPTTAKKKKKKMLCDYMNYSGFLIGYLRHTLKIKILFMYSTIYVFNKYLSNV